MEGIQAVRKIPHGHGQHQMGDLLQSIRRGHHAGGIDGLHIPVREGVGRQHLVIEGRLVPAMAESFEPTARLAESQIRNSRSSR